MLACSNSDLFRSVYSEQAIKGGLLGRTFIIKEDKARHKKSLFDLRKLEDKTTAPLLEHLKQLTLLKGEIKIESNAVKEYNSWYYDLPDDYGNDKIGFGSRVGTHVAKVAIALGAARENFGNQLIKRDIEESIDLVQGLRKNYRSISIGMGAAKASYQTALVVKAILKEKGQHIGRKKLVQRMFGETDIIELDGILMMLVQGGMIQEQGKGNEPGYKLTHKGIDVLVLGDTEDE